jgi:phospholipid transport system substrate-binding protein
MGRSGTYHRRGGQVDEHRSYPFRHDGGMGRSVDKHDPAILGIASLGSCRTFGKRRDGIHDHDVDLGRNSVYGFLAVRGVRRALRKCPGKQRIHGVSQNSYLWGSIRQLSASEKEVVKPGGIYDLTLHLKRAPSRAIGSDGRRHASLLLPDTVPESDSFILIIPTELINFPGELQMTRGGKTMSLGTARTGWWRSRSILNRFSIAALLCFLVSPVIASSTALETIKAGTDRVLQILKQQAGSKQTRRAEIRKVVDEYFDFNEMARRSLGPLWRRQSPEKQQEFTLAFSQFLFNVYIDKIEKYTDEKISYDTQRVEGDYAVVDAVVTGTQTGQITIEYHLHFKDGNWKAYDVAVEGIDLVNNYRSQFNSILLRRSFDDLLKLLREKNLQER